MAKRKKEMSDRPSEPPKRVAQKPSYAKPEVRAISEDLLSEQFGGLFYSLNPLHFGDTWEGCHGGDNVSSEEAG